MGEVATIGKKIQFRRKVKTVYVTVNCTIQKYQTACIINIATYFCYTCWRVEKKA